MKINNKFSKFVFNKKDRMKGLVIPAQISPELCYLCGILVGDGSIYGRKEKNEYLIKCVGNPKDEKALYYEIIGPRFKNIFGFIPKIKLCDSGTTFGFIIYSKSLYNYLTQHIGLISGKKDQKLCIPALCKENKINQIYFLRGIFDTDGCITFKKRYKKMPYYPVISISSSSKKLIKEIAEVLKDLRFNVVEIYDYKLIDKRVKAGYTIINRLEMNGVHNLNAWLETIGFDSPKHLEKIRKNREGL
jgi:intein/homing endonuclease